MDTSVDNVAVFAQFPKIARFCREVVVTEKIDGTNAQILISDTGPITLKSGRVVPFMVGSRNRWIFPEADNNGFARWAYDNEALVLKLGHGRHFGEWWGAGIQRRYGQDRKRLSLFNTMRWREVGSEPVKIAARGNSRDSMVQDVAPDGIEVVPVLWKGKMSELNTDKIMADLKEHGSYAAPGYMNPEGIVIYHVAGNLSFKRTFEGDETGKEAIKLT